ncbi:MAG: hypothetical protein ACK55Z_18840, partial [bacterium]
MCGGRRSRRRTRPQMGSWHRPPSILMPDMSARCIYMRRSSSVRCQQSQRRLGMIGIGQMMWPLDLDCRCFAGRHGTPTCQGRPY